MSSVALPNADPLHSRSSIAAHGAAPAEVTFPAMGTEVHVAIVGDADLLDRARERIEDLEARWSRFRPQSEMSRLNATPGVPVMVSDETFGLVSVALQGWRATAGAFDPTVLDAMIANGYGRSFELLDGTMQARPANAGAVEQIALDPATRAITLPHGTGIDPGGIGKGLAADVVVADLLDRGAESVCVNIGGDLRIEGSDAWDVDIEHPGRGVIASVRLVGGAVATTSRRKRAWRTDIGDAHHLIDPATLRPVETTIEGVSVVTGEAWWAEVIAKAAFVAGERAARTIASFDATGIVVHAGGRCETVEEERAS